MFAPRFSEVSRLALRLGAVAALACLPACGGPLDDDEGANDDTPEIESTEEGLAPRLPPGGGGELVLDDPVIPSEMPVCQDCEATGAVGLSTINGVVHLTLRGVSAGTRMTQLAGTGTPYATTDDLIAVGERRLIGGSYQYVQVWSAPIAGFEPGLWSRTLNRLGTYVLSNGVTLTAQAMSLAAAPAALRVSANYKGTSPLYKATIYALGAARGGGIYMAVPFVGL